MTCAPRLPTVLVLAGLILAGVAQIAGPADAHGSTQTPASRVYSCRFDDPDNPMCAAAWSSNSQALYDWMEVNIGDAAGRHRELIPDGQLCSAGRPKYQAFDRPGNWPVTDLRTDGSGLVDLVYQNTAPHSTEYYRVYITGQAFDARTDTLNWADLELVFDSGPLERAPRHRMRAPLPSRAVPAVLYIVWQRSDSPEAFYACSDVTVSGGSSNPPTTAPPPTSPPTSPAPGLPSTTDAPPTTATPTTGSSTTAPSTAVPSTAAPPPTTGASTNPTSPSSTPTSAVPGAEAGAAAAATGATGSTSSVAPSVAGTDANRATGDATAESTGPSSEDVVAPLGSADGDGGMNSEPVAIPSTPDPEVAIGATPAAGAEVSDGRARSLLIVVVLVLAGLALLGVGLRRSEAGRPVLDRLRPPFPTAGGRTRDRPEGRTVPDGI